MLQFFAVIFQWAAGQFKKCKAIKNSNKAMATVIGIKTNDDDILFISVALISDLRKTNNFGFKITVRNFIHLLLLLLHVNLG